MLTDLVIGKHVDEAMAIHEDVPRADAGQGHRSSPTRTCSRTAIAFAGVAKFPARVKCALLSWMAWKDATAQASIGGAQS